MGTSFRSSSSTFRSGTSSFRPSTSTNRYTPPNKSVAAASREAEVGKPPVSTSKVSGVSTSIPNRSQVFILQSARPIPYATQRVQPSVGTNWLIWYLIYSSFRSHSCVYRPDYDEGGSTGIWSPLETPTPSMEATPNPDYSKTEPKNDWNFSHAFWTSTVLFSIVFLFALIVKRIMSARH